MLEQGGWCCATTVPNWSGGGGGWKGFPHKTRAPAGGLAAPVFWEKGGPTPPRDGGVKEDGPSIRGQLRGSGEALVLGPFRLLAARRELLAHGVPVALGQRAFEILLTLVSRHGQLVTKDELMAEVWPGVVVEENNIQVHISAVRKVLAAAGDGDRYLLTVAGRGYRFLAPVTRESPGEPKTAGLDDQTATACAALSAATNNRPHKLTTLIVREADLAEIKARLR